jgi:hypothetical protein
MLVVVIVVSVCGSLVHQVIWYYRHDIHMELITQLKNPAIRRRLKTTNENRSPGGTPIGGWKRGKHYQSDMMPYFNKKLIDKFKSIRSPSPASPRFAESPI